MIPIMPPIKASQEELENDLEYCKDCIFTFLSQKGFCSANISLIKEKNNNIQKEFIIGYQTAWKDLYKIFKNIINRDPTLVVDGFNNKYEKILIDYKNLGNAHARLKSKYKFSQSFIYGEKVILKLPNGHKLNDTVVSVVAINEFEETVTVKIDLENLDRAANIVCRFTEVEKLK